MEIDDSEDLLALEEVEFPRPRSDCIVSVKAARRFVYKHNGATKEEIVEALKPEDNHRIGLAAVQILGKLGDSDSYREWWWKDVVEPGLRALADIQAPNQYTGEWRPIKRHERRCNQEKAIEGRGPGDAANEDKNTIVSTADVRNIVGKGYMFELEYEECGSEQRVLVTYGGKVRPAAKPVNSPPAFRFQSITQSNTYTISLPDLESLYPVSIAHLPDPMHEFAISAMVSAAKDDPSRVPLSDAIEALEIARTGSVDLNEGLALALILLRNQEGALNMLGPHLFPALEQSDTAVGRLVLEEIEEIAVADPLAIEPYVTEIGALSTSDAYAWRAARCLATLAQSNPTAVLDAVPTLMITFDSDDDQARQWTIYTFSIIAKEYPEELFPALDVLIDAIQTGDDTTRMNALSAVGRIANGYPDAATTIVEDLASLVRVDDPQVRANAVGLLGDIAQEHPQDVIEYGDILAGRLTDPDTDVRHNASITLVRAGEADPESIRSEYEQLEAALTDSNPEVRRNACALIGNTAAPVSMQLLRELETDDPDDEVRQRAEWAVKQLTR